MKRMQLSMSSAALAMSVAVLSSPAHAWYSRMSALQCRESITGGYGGIRHYFGTGSGQLQTNGQTSQPPGFTSTVLCPIADTDLQPRTSVAWVGVELYDESSSLRATSSVCISDGDTFDLQCTSTPLSTPVINSPQSYLLGFSGSSLPANWATLDGNHEYYHAFVSVVLPYYDSWGQTVRMQGYWSSN